MNSQLNELLDSTVIQWNHNQFVFTFAGSEEEHDKIKLDNLLQYLMDSELIADGTVSRDDTQRNVSILELWCTYKYKYGVMYVVIKSAQCENNYSKTKFKLQSHYLPVVSCKNNHQVCATRMTRRV